MKAIPVGLTAVGLVLLVVAAGAFKNVVIGNPDGPRWVYALFAAVLICAAAGLFGAAWRAWRALR